MPLHFQCACKSPGGLVEMLVQEVIFSMLSGDPKATILWSTLWGASTALHRVFTNAVPSHRKCVLCEAQHKCSLNHSK